jgi:pyruvate dehydrogenase E2 component (dihydrolipoamide acetyltransferase)
MVTKIEMPKYGLSMEEGTIVSWLVLEGDEVRKGDELVEVSTEKITNTVLAPADGVLRKILVEAEKTVPCGKIIAIITDRNEDISDSFITEKEVAVKKVDDTTNVQTKSNSVKKNLGEIKITPRAKKIAENKGIDCSGIVGTGIGGAITIDDIKEYINNTKNQVVEQCQPTEAIKEQHISMVNGESTPAEVSKLASVFDSTSEKKMSQMEAAIAKKMFESISTTAQTTISTDADITFLAELYDKRKQLYNEDGFKLSYTAILIKAVAVALEKHPKLRTRITEKNTLNVIDEINIGVAVDIPDGLVVPVIKNANVKSLKAICKELTELADKARTNKITLDDISGGILTITNLGMFGIKYFTPVINLPESAILGIGAITKELTIKDGGIFTRSIMNMSLTHDHRVISGAPAARFLQEVKDILTDFRRFV